MRLVILEDYESTSEWAAKYVRNAIQKFKPGPNKYFILGLPTGVKLALPIKCIITANNSVIKYSL